MELIAGIMLDVFFFTRFIYIKTQFYKTKGIANGNGNQYSSEFIYGNKGHNYVCSVKKNTSNIIPAISSISYTSYLMLFDSVKCNVFACFLIYLMLLFVFSLNSSELLNKFTNPLNIPSFL